MTTAQQQRAAKALGVTLALVLGAGSAWAQTDPAPPAAPQKLEGAPAWQALVGNTVTAASRDGSYTEFYKPDGTLVHVDKEGKSEGTWKVTGSKVCFDYPDDDDKVCVNVQVDGTKGTFVDDDGSKDTFDILTGNAKQL